MVNSLGQDWLRSRMLPVILNYGPEDLNTRNSETASLLPFLEDAWMIILLLPVFLKGWHFKLEKELQAQPRTGLAQQKVARLLFFGCPRGYGV